METVKTAIEGNAELNKMVDKIIDRQERKSKNRKKISYRTDKLDKFAYEYACFKAGQYDCIAPEVWANEDFASKVICCTSSKQKLEEVVKYLPKEFSPENLKKIIIIQPVFAAKHYGNMSTVEMFKEHFKRTTEFLFKELKGIVDCAMELDTAFAEEMIDLYSRKKVHRK